jgi:hypothetical protein
MLTKRVVIGSETTDGRKIDLDSVGSKIALPVTLYDNSGNQISAFGGVVSIPTSVGDGRKTVTTAGTRVALSTTTSCKKVTIQALDTNTDAIVVGGSTVVAASATRRGIVLLPYNSFTISVDDLADIYIDSVVSGEGVTYLYEI